MRPGLGKTYGRENATFRDFGRRLSPVRDAQVLSETIGKLAEIADRERAAVPFAAVREWAEARRRRVLDDQALPDLIGLTRDDLGEARRRASDWDVRGAPLEALAGGLRDSYRRARAGCGEAKPDAAPEAFHAWRKQVKYHWHHCRLMRAACPEMMKPRIRALDAVAGRLGDDHDLAVLRQVLREEAAGEVPDADMRAVETLAIRVGRELRGNALDLAPPLFVETPKALAHRIVDTWAGAGQRERARK